VPGGGAGNIAPVNAQVGQTVTGSGGVALGTVSGTDAQGNVQVAMSSGETVALRPGLVANGDNGLVASTTSRQDLMAMAATQQGDQQAAAQASTRSAAHSRHHRIAAGRAHRVPVNATSTEGADVNGGAATPQEQPTPPATTQMPAQPEQKPAQPEQQQMPAQPEQPSGQQPQ
jgi:hypothetical protein